MGRVSVSTATRMTRQGVFLLLCCTAMVLFFGTVAGARPFQYVADNTPLHVVLCAFAQSESKACEVSPTIQGTISGDLRFESGTEFYGFLERNQNIVSYQNSSGVFFYPRSEMQTELFTVNNIAIGMVRQTLVELGMYDKRYPLKWMNNGHLLKLVAPPAYADAVAEVLTTLESSAPPVKRSSKVFRLRHAWADDITLNFMEKEVEIPGVASLLRNLTGEGAALPSGAGRNTPTVQRLKGQGMMRRSGTQPRNGDDPRRTPRQTAQSAAQNLPVAETVQNRGGARIIADPRLNAVVVWDEASRMPYYQQLVDELDVPAGLVEIRAAIIDVSVNKMEELGISWGYNRRVKGDGVSVIGGANVQSTADFQNMEGSGLNVSTIFVNGIDQFMNRIHALEQKGDASVLSRPAVLTMDNIQAVLEVTNTFYVQVPGAYEVDLFDVTYGTVLRVTPHIVRDSIGKPSVKLVVHIEDGGSRVAPKDSGLTLPIISRTTISTQAVVGESQALIIGGHYYETTTRGASGIPVLMNIPVLGALFKDQSESNQKQERLFVISPRLVDVRDVPERMNDINKEEQERMQKAVERNVLKIAPPRSGCARSR